MEGSRIVLIPNVETGLLAQRPENTVMQALESLNDNQVNDFLSGKTPLNLSMRLGDHMMLIQLQLSTANPKPNEVGSSGSVPNTNVTSSSRSNRSSHHHQHHHHHSHRIKTCVPQPAPIAHQSSASRKIDVDSPQSSVPLSEADIHRIKNHVNSVNNPPPSQLAAESAAQQVDLNKNTTTTNTAVSGSTKTNSSSSSYKPLVNTDMEQSPIKSLSNLVSGPIKTTINNIPTDSNASTTIANQTDSSSKSSTSLPDPISAKLTSCLCTRLGGKSSLDEGCHDTSCNYKPSSSSLSSSSTNKYVATKIRERRRTIPYGNQPIPSSSLKPSLYRKVQPQRQPQATYVPTATNPTTTTASAEQQANSTMSITDNVALAEASRNLTQTLRKLSKDVFCHKIDHHQHHSHHTATEATSERKMGSGAVIESMKNHGKGIYSGTFSGTLNPALQDRYGRPKRDISTVIHILNDLLSATPHYTRGAKFSLEPSINSSSSSSSTMLHTKYRMNDYRKNQQQQQYHHHHHQSSNSSASTSSSSSSLKCQRCVKPVEYSNSSSLITPIDANTDLSNRNNSSLLANFLPYSNCSNKICTLDNRNTCACRTDDLSGEREMCNKCSSELENSKTKYKMDNLRLVMQQRKEKREARKMKGAPYGARLAATTTTAAAGTATTSPSEAPHIIEEVDTVA
ncbi:MIDN family protein [Megaselia abdita]